jgi:hypothetical protein
MYHSYRKKWKRMGFLKHTDAPVPSQQPPKKPKKAVSEKLVAGPSLISTPIPTASSSESKGESVQ